MSKFSENGKDFEFRVETEDGRDIVTMCVDGKSVDAEYVTLGNATCDRENIASVETTLMERNGYGASTEVVCPVCGAVHKRDSPDNKGWWIYETGKWACDGCGAEGTVWYQGDEVSSLSVED